MDKEYYNSLYDLQSQFQPGKITNDDLKISLLVANEILAIGKRNSLVDSQEIELLNLLNSVAPIFYDIGCYEAASKTYSILSNIDYYLTETNRPELFVTYAEVFEKSNGQLAKTTVSIAVPSVVNNVSSVFMAHEVSHALKETNPWECKLSYRLSEMIPMLIELIAGYNKDKIAFKEVITGRFNLLFSEAYYFKKIFKEVGKYSNDKIPNYLYAALGSTVVYLNSFYYTVAFFRTYLSYPDTIIKYINLVLNNALATEDIIEDSINRGLIQSFLEEYRKGMDFIKKI